MSSPDSFSALSPLRRSFASSPLPSPPDASASGVSPSYASIHSKLTSTLHPSFLQLEDTSGGCGTFYRLVIASPRFEGVSLVKQHRMVKDAIKEDIAGIHGLTIHTLTEAQYRDKKAAQEQANN